MTATVPRAALGAAVLALIVVACTSETPAPSAIVPPSLALPLQPTPRATRPVTVRVLGPAGAVAGAKVCATRIGGEEQCATSGGDGQATVQLIPGTYSVRAVPAAGARLAESVVTVDLREERSVILDLAGKATIAGTIRAAGGAAVPEAEVCAHGATLADVKCARSRADGTYRVEVRPGVHKVEVTGAPGSRALAQWARGRVGSFEADLIDTRTADATGVDLVLRPGVVLSGVVTGARDGLAVKDAQVCTYTLAAPLGWDCERTDKNGRYAVLREPGSYWVWIIPPGVRGSRLMYQRYDHVLEGVDATAFVLDADRQLNVALTEGVVLRGRVLTADGAPVVLALVCVDTPFPTGRICRESGDDGVYEVATRPQTYVVQVLPPDGSDVIGGFWPDAQPDWTRAGEVRVSSTGAALDITLPRGVRLGGTVRDARGAPIENATISVIADGVPRWFAGTDIAGRYSVAVPPGGTYAVDVFPPRTSPTVSVLGQRITVNGEVGYDVVLPDARP